MARQSTKTTRRPTRPEAEPATRRKDRPHHRTTAHHQDHTQRPTRSARPTRDA
ncbi:hypothetical protein [Streptomyces sp. NRRL S-350]|uniref:hypothetical protein n=1 Tax=Streptomyces sp. NRRL S-350 TaxID=1463902 RepID=UPI00131C2533|nr:hypothetical protein [Streptomyces sp. NRRL S-350]